MPAHRPSPQHKMVGWFDIRQLVPTGIRTAISTVFGEFADRREAIASARFIDPKEIDPKHCYADKIDDDGSFWFDFVADTGDGWNPTYAIAHLLADPKLKVPGLPEREGIPRLLIMGGDQVYPTADRDAYGERLIAPFKQAWETHGFTERDTKADLYAIPGNHDWYDGLSAFLGIFCRRRDGTNWNTKEEGRHFGGRQTQQTRSYFALSLPHDWWVWGVDVQLGGYIDQPQIDFFLHVAREWMRDGSRLIICTGNPEWAYVDPENAEKRFRNFDYVSSLAARANKDHRLCAVLTGDSHHYSRYRGLYRQADGNGAFKEEQCQYVTAGGGGAFLHPTHTLRTPIEFVWDYPPPGVRADGRGPYLRRFELATDRASGQHAVFPARERSRRLAWGDLTFPFRNWTFSLVMGGMWAIFAWLLSFNAGNALTQKLAQGGWLDAAGAYLALIVVSPWPVALLAVAALGFYYFSDFKPMRRRVVSGLLHAAAHFVAGTALAIVGARCLAGGVSPAWLADAVLVLLVLAAGWLLAGLIFGVYLLISVLRFDAHSNEAFSALAIEGYKNFLRLRIGANGDLTIYPIGLTTVPNYRGGASLMTALQPRLIEGPFTLG